MQVVDPEVELGRDRRKTELLLRRLLSLLILLISSGQFFLCACEYLRQHVCFVSTFTCIIVGARRQSLQPRET